MAVLPTNLPTLADHAKRLDPDGRVAAVAELLDQTNNMLIDAVWKEGNLPTGERVTIRTGLPTVYYRSLNRGIPSSSSKTAQVDEGCSILEARSEIDKDVAMLNGNTAEFRLSEDIPFIEAMNQTQQNGMIYGNPATEPDGYLGLIPRYSSKSAPNAQNIIDCGGTTGELASILIVCWSPQTVYGIFPKGSVAGLLHEDLGEQTVYTQDEDGPNLTAASSTRRMQALVTRYQWKAGLVVKDWRYVVRLCNIDITALAAGTGTQDGTASTSIVKAIARGLYRIPNMAMGRCAIYMNRTVHSGLSQQAMEKAASVLKVEDGLAQFGTPRAYTSYLGVPIRLTDAMLNTESKVN